MVLDEILLHRLVGHALLAPVEPAERGLDAVRRVVGERERDGAGRRDRQRVAVADAVRADRRLDGVGQARREARRGEVLLRVEQRERALVLGDLDGGHVRGVAHLLGDAGGHRASFRAVVAQVELDQRVAEPGEAQPHAALVHRLLPLLRQRPRGHVEDVVEHPHADRDGGGEAGEIEARAGRERILHEARQVDAAQVAAAVRRERLLAAGIAGFDRLAIREVVVAVHRVDEHDARLGVIVGRQHDLVPQRAGAHGAVHPQVVVALVRARREEVGRRRRLVHQLPVGVLAHGRDEGVGHRDREVEVGEPAVVLGVDERLDVRMIAAQDAHLGAAPRARRLHGRAALVEHPHVGERSAGAAVRALDVRALRADVREVVAHAAAAAHRLGGLVQRHVDADAVLVAGDAVAHRLDEAIDERGLEVRARGGIDPPAEDEAVLLGLQERLLPLRPLRGRLDGRQRARDAAAYGVDGLLAPLGVFLEEDLLGDRLRGQRGGGGRTQGLEIVEFHGDCRVRRPLGEARKDIVLRNRKGIFSRAGARRFDQNVRHDVADHLRCFRAHGPEPNAVIQVPSMIFILKLLACQG